MRASRERREYLQAMAAAREFHGQIRHSVRRRFTRTLATFSVFLVPTASFAALYLDVQSHVHILFVIFLTILAGPYLCAMGLFKVVLAVDPTISLILTAILMTLVIMKCLVHPRFESVALLFVGWVLCSAISVVYALYQIAPLGRLPGVLVR